MQRKRPIKSFVGKLEERRRNKCQEKDEQNDINYMF